MAELDRPTGVAVELVSRVQLRAVFSGLAVGAGVYAVCMGISWAIGLSTFQPTVNHARGLALGNVIWGAIALWISLFFGAYVAALAGRSPDARSGVLHGVVVWGASAALLGFMLVAMFGRLLAGLVEMSETVRAAPPPPHALGGLANVAGVAAWLYWAGVVGGLFTSIVGGFLGARSEERERLPERPARVIPPVPQPV